MDTQTPPNDSQQWKVWLGTIVSVGLATLAVGARKIARGMAGPRLWWDDFFIYLAWLSLSGMAILRIFIVVYCHYGSHVHYVDNSDVYNFWKAFIGIQALYFTTATLSKGSLLCLYYRLFGPSMRFRAAVWLSSGIVVSYWIPCIVLAFVGCRPFRRNWDEAVVGSCINRVAFFQWSGIANLAIDFLILLLPLPMIWGLKISMRQRLELTVLFMLGGFVTITSVLRVQAFKPDELKDVTYSTVDTIVWSIVEQGIGIVCACLPTMRPLLIRILSGRLQTISEEMGSFGILPDPATNYEPDVDILRSIVEPAQKSENTIGFARPHDNMVITLPVAQCSTCVSIAAITSPSAEDGDERPSPIIGVAL